MIYKVPMNDTTDRLALTALLVANGYMVWLEHQVGKELFLPNHIVCFCRRNEMIERCEDDNAKAKRLVNHGVTGRINCGGTYQLRQYE